jgi:cyclophilin family peptidyl-prolyl cis-trans isomerase
VVDTAKGTFEIQTYPGDAPKSVAHVVDLVRRRFYNGHRIHRVEPGFVVQFGDPYSRDMSRRERWGTGGSGTSVGVSEARRTHGVGAVALAHAGDPRGADSQMYVTLAAVPRLDRDFTVFGQVVSGMDVVRALEVEDVIKRITIKAAAPAAR